MLASDTLTSWIADACPTPYTIKSGDTFDSLAKISGLSLVNLEAANPGVDYANIQVGQQVTIPCSEAATAPVLPPPGAAPAGAGTATLGVLANSDVALWAVSLAGCIDQQTAGTNESPCNPGQQPC